MTLAQPAVPSLNTIELSPQQFRQAFGRLSQQLNCTHAALFDSANAPNGQYIIALGCESSAILAEKNKQRILTITQGNIQTETIITGKEQLFELLEALTGSNHLPFDNSISREGFHSGWVCALGYELNQLLEPSVETHANATRSESKWPLLVLFNPQHVVNFNAQHQTLAINTNDNAARETITNCLKQNTPAEKTTLPELTITAKSTEDLFYQQTQKLLHHIQQGDIYQANLSMAFETNQHLNHNELWSLYLSLVEKNPSPFSGVFFTPQVTIISNSPERLVNYNADSQLLTTQPIAGTRSRGKTPQQDLAQEQELYENPKERAEHLMLVDLMRNDLGRVAQPASVSVPNAFFVERYQHVMHLVSHVQALKAPNARLWDVIDAVFPGGTITGCPKVRCMELLTNIEQHPRGFYTGSLGYIDSHGYADFNILIRSVYQLPHGPLTFNAGAGIVADSTPTHEYKECHKKATTILNALNASLEA